MPFIVARTVVSLLRRRVHTKKQEGPAAEKRDEVATPHGAYPKAKDHRRSIAGGGAVARVAIKKRRLCARCEPLAEVAGPKSYSAACGPDRAARPCRLHLVGRGEQCRWHVERDSQDGTLWNISSLALYAGCADYLAPLLRKFDNEFAELGGRAYKWFCAQIDEPRVERRISKDGIHLLIEDRDDLRRRVRGCSNAIPTERLVTRHKIPDRGNIRQCVQTCGGRDP